MCRKLSVLLLAVVPAVFALSAAGATRARPWADHAAPFDFEFGNHIDTHQQSLAKNDMLQGFFYITFTGDADAGTGLPVANHADCSASDVECVVGWVWHGVAWSDATYCGHPSGGGHPTWAIEDADQYLRRGYSHFHWIDEAEHADGLHVGETYDGYLLRLTAIDSFYFAHHGGFAITPGIERQSHNNVVEDCSELR